MPRDASADVWLCLQHIVKCHGSTLLPQFLGMYRVSVDNEETYLMVMRNMFSHRLVVHRKYDLKVRGCSRGGRSGVVGVVSDMVFLQGSLVDREASDKERVRTFGPSVSAHLPPLKPA